MNDNTILTSASPEVVDFIVSVQRISDDNYNKNFPSLPHDKFYSERGSKFLAIDHLCSNGQRMVFCFIAACDSQSKGMGMVKKGDILKPDGWKKPAKHARGNLFNADKGIGCVGPYGVQYLK